MASARVVPRNPITGRSRADPSKRFFLVFIIGVVLAAIGAVGAKPVYRLVREQRGLSVADEIDELMTQEPRPVTEIARKLRVGLELAPGEPRLLRQAAVYLAAAGQETALNYYEMLIGRKLATHQERLDYIALALDFNHLEKAQLELTELLKVDSRDTDAMRLSIRLLQAKGDHPRAVKAARVALATYPLSEEFQHSLGVVLLQDTNATLRAEGRRLLFGLALSSGPYHDRAVDSLTVSTNLTRLEGDLLAKELLARTNISLVDQVGLATLRLSRDPEKRTETIRQTLAQIGALTNTNSLFVVSAWLWRLREHEMLLDAIPAKVARTNSALLTFRLESLAELKRWDELQPFLDESESILHPVYLHCLRGIAAVGKGSQEASGHFDLAIRAAQNSPARLVYVARFAEAANQPETAIAAWKPLLSQPTSALGAAREILRLAKPMDDLRISRDVVQRVSVMVPNDDGIGAQLSYLNLILGERVADSVTVARRIAAAHPDEMDYRFILALGELRSNAPGAALSLLEQNPFDWETLEERWRAVYVAVLGNNTQREAARQFARKVRLDRLKSVERDLVKPWL